jgi:O-antigen/teichoic acid export membrane protein
MTKSKEIWTTSALLFFLVGIVVATITTIITFPLGHSFLIFFLIVFSNLASHYLTLPESHGRFDIYNLRVLLTGTANTFLAAYFAWLNLGITTILLGQLTSYCLLLLILHHYSKKHLTYTHYSPLQAQLLLSFGIRNQLGKFVNQLSAQYPKFLLTSIGSLAISTYTIAQNIVVKMAGGLTQLSRAIYPATSRNNHSPKIYQLYHRLQISLVLLGILSIVIYHYFGYPFLVWWLSDPKITQSVHSVLRVYIWYFSLLILTPIPANILDSHNRPGLTSLLGTLTFITEFIVAIILLPQYQILSPAYAGIISLLIFLPILLYHTEKELTRSGKKSLSDN